MLCWALSAPEQTLPFHTHTGPSQGHKWPAQCDCSALGPDPHQKTWPGQPPRGGAALKSLRRGRTRLGWREGALPTAHACSLTSCRAARSWGHREGWHFCTSW